MTTRRTPNRFLITAGDMKALIKEHNIVVDHQEAGDGQLFVIGHPFVYSERSPSWHLRMMGSATSTVPGLLEERSSTWREPHHLRRWGHVSRQRTIPVDDWRAALAYVGRWSEYNDGGNWTAEKKELDTAAFWVSRDRLGVTRRGETYAAMNLSDLMPDEEDAVEFPHELFPILHRFTAQARQVRAGLLDKVPDAPRRWRLTIDCGAAGRLELTCPLREKDRRIVGSDSFDSQAAHVRARAEQDGQGLYWHGDGKVLRSVLRGQRHENDVMTTPLLVMPGRRGFVLNHRSDLYEELPGLWYGDTPPGKAYFLSLRAWRIGCGIEDGPVRVTALAAQEWSEPGVLIEGRGWTIHSQARRVQGRMNDHDMATVPFARYL